MGFIMRLGGIYETRGDSSNSFSTTSHHDYQRLASFLPTKSQPNRRLFAAKLR
jgi:hypothetical protein